MENTVQIQLLSISDRLDLPIYGGDASDVFTHIPGPSVTTFVLIDEQFYDCYRHKLGNNIHRDKVLTVLKDLQVCLGSGRIW